MSFFGTNPLSTHIGQLVDKATDVSTPDENVQLYYEIADLINIKEDNAKDAIKAIKKKLSIYGGRNWSVVTKVLNLLELCASDCNKPFHLQLAQKDFLQDLKNLIGPKLQPPLIIQEKVLHLIHTWTLKFKNDTDLKAIESFYNDMRSKGIDFPVVDPSQNIISQAISSDNSNPTRTATVAAASAPYNTLDQASRNSLKQSSLRDSQPVPLLAQKQQPKHIPINAANSVVTLTPEQCAKLNSELDIVESNGQVFNEVLNQLQTINLTRLHDEFKTDIVLLRDLNRTCNEMQSRITQLITSITNENIIDELLRINDDLNNVFLRYERFERSLPKAISTVPTGSLSPVAVQVASVSPVSNSSSMKNSKTSRIMHNENKAVAEEKSLIDFGDDDGPVMPKSNLTPQKFNTRNESANEYENEERNAFLKDQNEIQEMENWLRAQGDNELEKSDQNGSKSITPPSRQVKTEAKNLFSL